ncbi:MAG: RsmE family RNA methyltransferase, partial [Terriglobales bacterium]
EIEAPLAETARELAVALFKNDRWEWMVEKATELGLTKLQPILSRRSDPRLAAAAPSRLERWRTIAFEAAQQSRRIAVPAIEAPLPFEKILGTPSTATRILLAEGGGAPPLAANAGPVYLLCGPEGGWTEDEVAAASAAGFAPASLGPRILRCETAALAALARLAH